MTVTPSSFKIRFPEFSSVDDSRVQLFIDDASLINAEVWSVKYDLGVSYLAAHYLKLAADSSSGTSSAGKVQSRSVDGASVSFATLTPADGDGAYFSLSPYGERYFQMRANLVSGVYVV